MLCLVNLQVSRKSDPMDTRQAKYWLRIIAFILHKGRILVFRKKTSQFLRQQSKTCSTQKVSLMVAAVPPQDEDLYSLSYLRHMEN